jgi:hypothetical protein
MNCHLFRGPGGHETAPAVAAFRAQVDEMVRALMTSGMWPKG